MDPLKAVLLTPLSDVKLWHAMVAVGVLMALYAWLRRVLEDA